MDLETTLLPDIETADNFPPAYDYAYQTHPTIGALGFTLGTDCEVLPGEWLSVHWGLVNVDTHDACRPETPNFLAVPEGIKHIRLETQLGFYEGGSGFRALRFVRFSPNGEVSIPYGYAIHEPRPTGGSILNVGEILPVSAGERFEVQIYHDAPEPIGVNEHSHALLRMIHKLKRAREWQDF